MIEAQVTPFALVADLAEAVGFYEALGFACTFRTERPAYAYMRASAGGVRLLETDLDLEDERRQQMIYVDVSDVDAWWETHRSFLDCLPEGRARAPFDQDYGQREAHVIHGPTLLMFGTAIP